ncbi:HK97 family phage prohead protease [Olivibacter sp. LS-1]|uniref:HK97 family phage prohead protease n=1 Tax=Olivibacter sp. LS-1 TaxID=2592345 RepID=UPI0011EB8B66|nr:HK97 family phage prohead protease [Olivibacter sp. LS-1]QEL01132.1 HK97 family phage prohead protease [Olivibacter sp. LS-1]
MLYKGLSASFKEADVNSRFVSGYLSHFGSKDSDGDIIVKGAFNKTIRERGPSGSKQIKYLLDHDKKHAIGVFEKLEEDSQGLYYEARIGTHANGVDFIKMVESGIITEHSIGYRTIKEQRKSDGNHLHELMLLEGSALQFLGANPNTPVTGYKDYTDILEAFTNLEKALHNGTFTDETFVLIEAKYKSLGDALKPLSTSKVDEPISKSELIEIINKSFN